MSENTPPKSGFTIKSILLTNCDFSRTSIEADSSKKENDITVESSFVIETLIIRIDVTLKYYLIYDKGNEVVKMSITMTGFFESAQDSSLPLEQFGKANGPAIIYPYVREHFSSLMVKAGLGHIFLPPLNFSQKPSHKL